MARGRSLESLYVTAQPLILNALSMVITVLVVRRQGATRYGYWLTATTITSAVMFLTSFGMRPFFVRALARDPETGPRRVGEQMTLRTLTSLGAGLLAVLACLALGHPPIVLACVAIGAAGLVISGLVECFIDTLQAFERFYASANVLMASGLALQGASILATTLGGGPIALSLAYLVGPVVNLLGMGMLLAREHFPLRPVWNLARFHEILRESRVVARSTVVTSVQARLEQLILPKLVAPALFGQFGSGLIPAQRLTVIPSGLAAVFLPGLSRAHKHAPERGIALVRLLATLLLTTCLAAAIGVVHFGPWLASLLFPRDPGLCGQVITLTMWSLPPVGLNWAMITALQAWGHQDDQARALSTAAPLSLVATPLLIVSFGVVGASISWVMSASLNALFLLRVFRRVFPGIIARLALPRLAVACLAMQAALSAGKLALGTSLIALTASGLAGGGVFLLALRILKVVSFGEVRAMLARQPSATTVSPAGPATSGAHQTPPGDATTSKPEPSAP